MSEFDPKKGLSGIIGSGLEQNHLHQMLDSHSSLMETMQKHHRDERDRQARNSGRYDAEDIFQHLMNRVNEFENDLDDSHEIGLQLANFGVAAQIHIRSIGYRNPNLIEFHGVNADEHEVTLVQHISQLNFLLIAVKPIEETPYRIGF